MDTGEALKIGKVKRKPLAKQTADLLRESIEQGKLAPGTHLIETEVAGALGVSRGILREALRVLEQEGLVESAPGKGTRVTCPSESDIQEIYSLRQLLEGKATHLAAENANEADIAALEAICNEMYDFAQKGDLGGAVGKDLEFHQTIWGIAHHKILKNILEEMKVQIAVFLQVNKELYEYLATGPAEHKAILESIRKRDGENASRQMVAHLEDAAQAVTNYFRQVQDEYQSDSDLGQ
jgi:DNA-binding GntR family transcriptional regulator